MVALDAASDGEQWYTSTVNLQLASLPLCIACRDVATLHVRVDMLTPRNLWDPAAQRIPGNACGPSKTKAASRVPPVRARSLRWERTVKFLEQLEMGEVGQVSRAAWERASRNDAGACLAWYAQASHDSVGEIVRPSEVYGVRQGLQ